jgi:hypothetical protein
LKERASSTDVEVSWSFEDAVAGRDRQLDYALRAVHDLQVKFFAYTKNF